MLSILKQQVRTESLPLLKHGSRVLYLSLTLLTNLLHLALNFILLFGLKLTALPLFHSEAPEIDLADVE
jgi:hypothetical protein